MDIETKLDAILWGIAVGGSVLTVVFAVISIGYGIGTAWAMWKGEA